MSTPHPTFIAPTTKAKQRTFVDTLIAAVADQGLSDRQLLRQLRVLRKQLRNRPAQRGRISAPASHTQRLRILQLKRRQPGLSMQEISHILRISIGRVSETLRGKRR